MFFVHRTSESGCNVYVCVCVWQLHITRNKTLTTQHSSSFHLQAFFFFKESFIHITQTVKEEEEEKKTANHERCSFCVSLFSGEYT